MPVITLGDLTLFIREHLQHIALCSLFIFLSKKAPLALIHASNTKTTLLSLWSLSTARSLGQKLCRVVNLLGLLERILGLNIKIQLIVEISLKSFVRCMCFFAVVLLVLHSFFEVIIFLVLLFNTQQCFATHPRFWQCNKQRVQGIWMYLNHSLQKKRKTS